MHASTSSKRAFASLCLLAILGTGCSDSTAPAADSTRSVTTQPNEFGVYTQNMYLGGDTGPLFTLDFTDLGAVIGATAHFWGEVQASNIPARAAKFVDRIDVARPDVVAMQEGLRFLTLDGAFHPTGGADLVASVQAEITRRGLPYELAVSQEATSATLPMNFDPSVGVTQWLNFTDRVVILRRTDVKVISSASGLYNAHLSLGPVTLVRAWARLTVDHNGKPYNFVTTQLETPPGTAIQDAQALELEAILGGLDGVTILAGDLNSDAAANTGTPTWTATYSKMIAAGFTDVWVTSPHSHGSSGFTCCQASNLLGPSQQDQRIDFVLVRSSNGAIERLGAAHGLFDAEIVGEEEADKTAGGLWPSDHAGIVATVRLPNWLNP